MEAMRRHVLSMWWSFFLAAVVTAYFGSRLSRRLDAQDAFLTAARKDAERSQRLASLTTLAAGAAHELSSPLATIAVATAELERSLRESQANATALDDLALIRHELARCRATLDRMSIDAGEAVGEAPIRARAGDIARAAIDRLPGNDAARVLLKGDVEVGILAPREALSQALTNLLRNALDADPTCGHVIVTISGSPNAASFTVKDAGIGMAPDVLERAGEPFFTTKPPGHGMGLGVFLTRAVVEQLGGQLRVDSRPGVGTTAVIEMPAGAISA
jgi:two-component system sensor histidine kinase RegB